jgi:SAM-dependent methyltransferase
LDPALVARFFEVEDYHWWFVGRRRIVFDQIRRHAPPGRLLDVGCGTGGILTHLGSFETPVGIDPAPEAIECCRRRNLTAAVASGTHLPFQTGVFSLALALDVIEHLENDLGLLREMWRVLAPGGVAILTVPALPQLWSSHDEVNRHHRRYMRSTLERRVRAAGLKVLTISYYNAFLLPLAAMRKLILRSAGDSNHHLERLPRPLNAALREVMSAERPLIRRWGLPLGASLLCVAVKDCRPAGEQRPERL